MGTKAGRQATSGRHLSEPERFCHAAAIFAAPDWQLTARGDRHAPRGFALLAGLALCRCPSARASVSDAAALAALLQPLTPAEPRGDTTRLALRLSEWPTRRVVLLAERDGKVLGTCTLNLIEHLTHNFARSAIIEDVVVDDAARSLGVGQTLMGKAIERARAWGCYKLALSSSQSREAAHAFYAGLWFKPHGISLALCWIKKLSKSFVGTGGTPSSCPQSASTPSRARTVGWMTLHPSTNCATVVDG